MPAPTQNHLEASITLMETVTMNSEALGELLWNAPSVLFFQYPENAKINYKPIHKLNLMVKYIKPAGFIEIAPVVFKTSPLTQPRPPTSSRSLLTYTHLDLTSAPLISWKQLVGAWRHLGLDSLSEQPLMCCHHPRTLSGVLLRSPVALCAQTQQQLNTFRQDSKAGLSQGRYTWRHNQVLKRPSVANGS